MIMHIYLTGFGQKWLYINTTHFVTLKLDLHRRQARRSDPTDCRWKKMRPGSIVVSGNKKRRSTYTETRRPGPDVLGMSVFIPRRPSGERGDNFIGSSYTSYSPFTASCLLIAIMQSQELDFLQMFVLPDRRVPLAVWVAQPAKKRRVGSDHRARRQWSSSLTQVHDCDLFHPHCSVLMCILVSGLAI